MLESIELKNFLSHANTKITFDEGVNVFIGKNGAGKSSVIDAITYVLYGKHARGLNANIIMHGAKKGSVTLRFSMYNKRYEVYREFNSNGSLITASMRDLDNGKQISAGSRSRGKIKESMDDMIKDIIGLDYKEASIASIIRQGELDAIIELKPSELRDLINKLIGLDRLDDAYEELRKILYSSDDSFRSRIRKELGYDDVMQDLLDNKLKDNIEKMNRYISMLDELNSALSIKEDELSSISKELDQLNRLRLRYDELNSKKEELIRYCKNRYEELKRKEEELEHKIDHAYKCLEVIKDKDAIKARYDRLKAIEPKVRLYIDYKEAISKLEREVKDYEAKIKEIKQKISSLKLVEYIPRDIESIKNEIYANEHELFDCKESLGKMDEKIKDYMYIIKHKRCPTCDSDIDKIDIDTKLRNKIKDKDAIKARIEELNNNIKQLRILEEKRKAYDQAQDKIKIYEDQLDMLERIYQSKLDDMREKKDYINILKDELSRMGLDVNAIDYDDIVKDIEYLKDRLDEIDKAIAWLDANAISSIDDIEYLKNEYERIRSMLKMIYLDRYDMKALAEFDDYARLLYNDILALERQVKDYDRSRHDELNDRLDDLNKEISCLKEDKAKCEERLSLYKDEISRLKHIKLELKDASRYLHMYEEIRDSIYHKILPRELRRWAFDEISYKASEYLRIFDVGIASIMLREEKNSIRIECYTSNGLRAIDSLSGGEKVAIALALRFAIASLLSKGMIDFIILDEPTMHLDQERKRALVKLISRLARKSIQLRQIIIITHDSEIFEDSEVDKIVRFEKRQGISNVQEI